MSEALTSICYTIPGVNILEDLELVGKFTPRFNDTNDADNDAYLVVFDAHKAVGVSQRDAG